jgi:DNA-binding NtrC family response regulator
LSHHRRGQSDDTTIEARASGDETEVPLSARESFGDAVGRSRKMREVFELTRRAAASDLSVLFLGETGTGKDILAKATHDHSARASGPFVAFNCAAAAPTLIESELFGHERGAFTTADRDRAGVFQRANRGTLFLNEIGELPPSLQGKLLHVLDSGMITPVGGQAELQVDVRVLAATNRDLRNMVANGRFRPDLYFRLAVVSIDIPPLRERGEDIPLLVLHFLRQVAARDNRDLAPLLPYLEEHLAALIHYRWPGNVRELRNVVERAAALTDSGELAKARLPHVVEFCSNITRMMSTRPPLDAARKQFDREYLQDVLTATQGDIERAATIAHIHPNSLKRLLRRYEMSR